MKVYVIIRNESYENEYCEGEYSDDYIESVYSNIELAKKNKPEDNKYHPQFGEKITYRIEEHEVQQ